MTRLGNVYSSERKLRHLERTYNQHMQLPEHFATMIGDKKTIMVADVGSGPINIIGDMWPGVDVKMYVSDVGQPKYKQLCDDNNITLITPIECQNMESLTYQDEMFDIVHCSNALDHTKNADAAINECLRVCKKNGWVYLQHYPNQMSTWRGHHYWDINLQNDNLCTFKSRNKTFNLSDIANFTSYFKNEMVVSIYQK